MRCSITSARPARPPTIRSALAAWGPTRHAVVDAALRVHGVEGLRVCDASIMPTMVASNTNAPSIMIGEKASDLVLGS